MSMYDWLKRSDKAIANLTAGQTAYYSLSPTRWSLYKNLHPLFQRVLRGRCLDAGAGRQAFADSIRPVVDEYISMDIHSRPGLNVIGSILNIPLQNESLDSIVCLQVLEHVPDPGQALLEFFHCLKPGGTLLLSVPHLGYLHNEPHDYFRFTKHGLSVLLQKAGYEILEIIPAGGLISFVGHIPSVVAKSLFFPIPGINRIAIYLNSIYAKTVSSIDSVLEKRKVYALNYIAIASKPMMD